MITKHKEKEAISNRHRIDDSKLKWTPLGPEIINEEMQSDDADDEEDEQLAKVIEESKRETMETPKTTTTEKKRRKRKKGMKGYIIVHFVKIKFHIILIYSPHFKQL